MRFTRTVAIVFACLMLFASVASAGVGLEGTHSIVSVVPYGYGSMVTVSLTLTNSGASGISDLYLAVRDPFFPPDDPANSMFIDGLPAGETIQFDWDVPTSLPPDQIHTDIALPLYLDVETVDAYGNTDVFQISSESEVR